MTTSATPTRLSPVTPPGGATPSPLLLSLLLPNLSLALFGAGGCRTANAATSTKGPTAPSAALEAPAQALVRAGETVGRVGTDYAKNAMQFENARNKLEVDFQMQRKNEQTRTLVKK